MKRQLTIQASEHQSTENVTSWDKYSKLIEYLGPENLLDMLVRMISSDDLNYYMDEIATESDLEFDEYTGDLRSNY